MYDGNWYVTNEDAMSNEDGLLGQAFADHYNEDPIGLRPMEGRVRTFIELRHLRNPIAIPTSDQSEDNGTNSNVKSTKAFDLALTGKMILFDGQFRNKEIDLYFTINPNNMLGPGLGF